MARAALTDPMTPANVQPFGPVAGLGDPVFSDEFAGTSLDSSKWIPWYPDQPFWNATTPGGHKTNTDEPQGYDETGITFPINSEGRRVMRFTFHESNHAVPELAYTSGMVCSWPAFAAQYGYFEARLWTPNEWGAWPAFWRMPTDFAWPPEEDIFENWGRDGFNTTSSSALHLPSAPSRVEEHTFAQDTGGRWRTYGELREPGRMRTYFDGVLVADWDIDPMYEREMYLLCNLAGDRNNHSGAAASAPFSMDVDYIRAWALDGATVEEAGKVFYGSQALVPHTIVGDTSVPLNALRPT